MRVFFGAYRRALSRLAGRAAPWVFTSCAGLVALAGVLTDNFLLTVPDAADTALWLNVFFACALPFLPDGGEEGVAGFLALLTAPVLCCALLAVSSILVKPGASSAVPALGLLCAGAPGLALCMLLRARIRRAWIYRLLAAPLLLAGCFAPAWLGSCNLSPAWARALIALTPASVLANCVSGILDVKGALYAAALCGLLLSLNGRASLPRRAARAAAFCALAALCVLLPATLFELDATEQGVLTPSDDLINRLRGLDTPVTVTLCAKPGGEDPWVRNVLQKLAERHPYLDFQRLAPGEDAAVDALSPEENSLLAENAGDRALMRAGNLYAETRTLTGTRRTFELEGALLTALSEVTGLDLLYGGAPPGRALNTDAFSPTPARAGALIILLLIWTALPVCAGLPLRKKIV